MLRQHRRRCGRRAPSSGSTLVASAIEPAAEGHVRRVTCWNRATRRPPGRAPARPTRAGPSRAPGPAAARRRERPSSSRSQLAPRRRRAARSSARSTGWAGFTTTGHRKRCAAQARAAVPSKSPTGVSRPAAAAVRSSWALSRTCWSTSPSGKGSTTPSHPDAGEHQVDRLLAARVDDQRAMVGCQPCDPVAQRGGRAHHAGSHGASGRVARPQAGAGPRRPQGHDPHTAQPSPRIPATAAFRCASGTRASISGWGRRDAGARAGVVMVRWSVEAFEGAEAMLRASFDRTLMGDPTG